MMHSIGWRAGFLLLAIAGTVIFAEPSMAQAKVITVSLWDKGSDAPLVSNRGLGAKDMSKASMGIKLSQTSIPAGEVTFQVTNTSKGTIHEMVVFPLDKGETQLPINKDEERIDEDSAHDLGEVSEMDPGQSGALTLNLKPGKYVLLCNVPGHYMNGMWSILTVTP